MSAVEMATGEVAIIDEGGLDHLISALAARGYDVVGPTKREGAIVLDELESVDDLPAGWGTTTGPGEYGLVEREDRMMFAHTTGPQGWKQFLHPSHRRLWSQDRGGEFKVDDGEPARYAFIGVRGCDMAAIRTLGRVLGAGPNTDSLYVERRKRLFVVAVNCTEPGEVCFCASMGTGPQVGPGYDLALTEIDNADGHRFIIDVASPEGADLLAEIPHETATQATVDSAREAVTDAAERMGRKMPEGDLRELLRWSRNSPQWKEIEQRCMVCGNCTLVCPTCNCTTTEDTTDLSGDHAERWQRWASCFELDFTYLHGGAIRQSGASRYRHWISHKLGTWNDQFGTAGCVGCGRCIAWCPAGIDITEEMHTLAGMAATTNAGSSDDYRSGM